MRALPGAGSQINGAGFFRTTRDVRGGPANSRIQAQSQIMKVTLIQRHQSSMLADRLTMRDGPRFSRDRMPKPVVAANPLPHPGTPITSLKSETESSQL